MAAVRGDAPLPADVLVEIERTAVEFAQLAGEEIVRALSRTLEVRYKSGPAGSVSLKDPVSEVDHEVERLIRLRLAETFPEHDIVGEEVEERTGREHDVVWVIDPIDGTTNFVNGFPLFAASIGVLCRGQPVAGALWCSTGHLLRHGVYHARLGAPLRFDGEPLEARRNLAVRRGLVGEPEATSGGDLPWDTRKTGSAAIECAFVAAGLLEVARFERPNVWDVGGGVALVRAAGGEVRTRTGAGWVPLDRFEASRSGEDAPADLRGWRQPVIVGERSAVDTLCQARA
jgi:myo-inositol-1(or 4)-monophosphatase